LTIEPAQRLRAARPEQDDTPQRLASSDTAVARAAFSCSYIA